MKRSEESHSSCEGENCDNAVTETTNAIDSHPRGSNGGDENNYIYQDWSSYVERSSPGQRGYHQPLPHKLPAKLNAMLTDPGKLFAPHPS